MHFQKKLFIHLLIALSVAFLIVSTAAFLFSSEQIEEFVKKRALEMSRLLANQMMQQHSMEEAMGMMEPSGYDAAEVMKEFGFYRFKVVDAKGNVVIDEVSPQIDGIQKQIGENGHSLKIHHETEAMITVMHAAEMDRYYLDIAMPFTVSPGNRGELTALYDATDQVKEFYNKLEMDMVGVGMTFLFLLLAGYPTILRLNKGLMDKTRALSQTYVEILKMLGSAIAKRDSETNEHNYRVTLYATLLGEAMNLSRHRLKILMEGSFLHDVGKIGISDTILLKPGKLTDEEFEVMKRHVSIGKEIIQSSRLLKDASGIVETHHEKYDGNGYPKGLKGDAIPLVSRIFCIADVFDALTSKRPYKEAFSFEESQRIMLTQSGSHFDPELLGRFFKIIRPYYDSMHSAEETALAAMLQEKIDRYFKVV